MKRDELMEQLLRCDGHIGCIFYKLKIFGIKDSDFTLEEIGKMLKITRERVRQIETQALKKIKHPKIAKLLFDYVRA